MDTPQLKLCEEFLHNVDILQTIQYPNHQDDSIQNPPWNHENILHKYNKINQWEQTTIDEDCPVQLQNKIRNVSDGEHFYKFPLHWLGLWMPF